MDEDEAVNIRTSRRSGVYTLTLLDSRTQKCRAVYGGLTFPVPKTETKKQ